MEDHSSIPTTTAIAAKKESSFSSLLLRGRRSKFIWAFAAVLLLALWSMFSGTVSLRRSFTSLRPLSDDLVDFPIHHDLDALEMEEMEEKVKQMWNAYRNTYNRRISLSRFWQEAFEAAYEDLTSEEDGGVRESAIREIAKMSVRSN